MIENTKQDTIEILKKMREVPKLYKGKELIVSFVNKAGFRGCESEELNLPLGATIRDFLKILPLNDFFYIYAKDEFVEKILDLPKGAKVTAKVKMLFGIYQDAVFTEDGPIRRRTPSSGLLIVDFVDVQSQAGT
ncbi:MAG: hypothetical protein H8D45_15905 [Bacteroidetes bacterium]|nr:hypothetical protein [Bacteroidota bacterium]